MWKLKELYLELNFFLLELPTSLPLSVTRVTTRSMSRLEQLEYRESHHSSNYSSSILTRANPGGEPPSYPPTHYSQLPDGSGLATPQWRKGERLKWQLYLPSLTHHPTSAPPEDRGTEMI